MKTVSVRVLSTKTISLSKAASILSKFVSAKTGASQAVCAYLQRASSSFSELSQLHKELKPHRKHETPKSKTAAKDENLTRSAVSSHEPSQPELNQELSRVVGRDFGVVSENRKHKKKRSGIENLEESNGEMGIEEDGNLGMENERKKQKKHRKEKGKTGFEIANSEEDKGKVGIEEDGDVGIENERKKRKKKKEKSVSEIRDFEENGDGILIEEEEKEERRKKKKRKSEEIEDGIEMNSEDLHNKKKKKRKTEGQS
ncbi:hypothetical protein JRO89_XS10G0144400 [Xanthoceras sorbifolium]|uniref:Uncharacterized protein n=1 Tax=Xanthoceras sorbifolium TaxID=99658 RepID=A0ABQ8HIS4_9ROSI|nr:hypothetical protein JRO89_XS10G0144400 [Xanthoceras sorbifolium]